MKITTTILSIPPYLSTTWKNISSLHIREEREHFTLVVILQNRLQVEVPGLNKEIIDAIFEAHAQAAEEESASKKQPFLPESPFSFTLPLKSGSPVLDQIGSNMQHNPEQADLPSLPPEVLKKIGVIARAFGFEDAFSLSKGEPHCNCIYCQVARSLQGEEETSSTSQEEGEEKVSLEDLKFRNWDIQQQGEKLYSVTNPLDANEHYSVFLGTPLGCTCGSKNCEHIRAVLSS